MRILPEMARKDVAGICCACRRLEQRRDTARVGGVVRKAGRRIGAGRVLAQFCAARDADDGYVWRVCGGDRMTIPSALAWPLGCLTAIGAIHVAFACEDAILTLARLISKGVATWR